MGKHLVILQHLQAGSIQMGPDPLLPFQQKLMEALSTSDLNAEVSLMFPIFMIMGKQQATQ